jgi:DNA polymerase-4
MIVADEVRAALAELAGRVVDDVRAEDRAVQRVHLKVRFAPFFTHTRSRTLPEPTTDAETVTAAALEVLERLDRRDPVRLLGVRADMTPLES